jgi:hypothetical protein
MAKSERSGARTRSAAAGPPALRRAIRALGLRVLGLAPEERPGAVGHASLIGVDVTAPRSRRPGVAVLSTLAAVLVVALGVSALRIELLRIRYALGEAMAQEQQLLEEQRSLTAEMRRLRDPVQLAERARRLGFVRPERLIDLPSPSERIDLGAETVLAARGALPTEGRERP